MKWKRTRFFKAATMRPMILVLGVVLTAVSGCSAGSPSVESLGRQLMTVWESGELDNLDAIMSDSASYVAVQQGHTYTGLAEIKKYVGHVDHFATDLRRDVLSVASTGSTATFEWEMTGVQSHPIPGKIEIATGKRFNIRGVTIVEVEGGLIQKASDYMDLLGFVMQLGARVELPGGVVIESE